MFSSRQNSLEIPTGEQPAAQAAWNWYRAGQESVFLQDADALAAPVEDLLRLLGRLRELFPGIRRITSYARSRTIARLTAEELASLRDAGLNRIHIGFESGSDEVLTLMRKGVTKEMQVEAGRKVKGAGIELSAYYMPGLGGRDHARANALETADLMNRVNPDFIRLRTLAVPDHVHLAEDVADGRFVKSGDVGAVEEILLFLENLQGISSAVVSDHVLNLLQDIQGRLPRDREKMLANLRGFLALEPEEQITYRIGRRRGVFVGLSDLADQTKRSRAERLREQLGATSENIDGMTDELVKRFI